MEFTKDELVLVSIYFDTDREKTIKNITEMRSYLENDESELLGLTNSAIGKLNQINDDEFKMLDLFPGY